MSEESCVVRILNLDESFTQEILKKLILTKCQPNGDIKNIYLKKDEKVNIFYGYVVFEHSYDAMKVIDNLNGYIYTTNKFEAELIGPNLKYRTFPEADEVPDEYRLMRCYTCRHYHFDIECPFKNVILAREKNLRERKFTRDFNNVNRHEGKAGSSKDIPHATEAKVRRDNNAWRDGTSYSNIYISNIDFSTTESDLKQLVQPFGPTKKLYLGKDKTTGRCKGFAYVNFKFRSDATKAISQLNELSFHDRVLKVEWSKT